MAEANDRAGIAAVAQTEAVQTVDAAPPTSALRRKVAKNAQSVVQKAEAAVLAKRSVDDPRQGLTGPAAAPVAPSSAGEAVEDTSVEITSRAVPSPAFRIKDFNMDMSANFNGFQDAMGQAQAKAQAAFEKSSALLGEAGDFAKGNVEAIIESGKILANGAQEIGSTFAAEGRTAFEAMSGDFKELAGAKSPADFFKLQGEIARKNLDNAVACGSKSTETFLKLMNDAFSPLSGRINLAVEKAREVSPLSAGWNKAA